jgi:hypothetical protein
MCISLIQQTDSDSDKITSYVCNNTNYLYLPPFLWWKISLMGWYLQDVRDEWILLSKNLTFPMSSSTEKNLGLTGPLGTIICTRTDLQDKCAWKQDWCQMWSHLEHLHLHHHGLPYWPSSTWSQLISNQCCASELFQDYHYQCFTIFSVASYFGTWHFTCPDISSTCKWQTKWFQNWCIFASEQTVHIWTQNWTHLQIHSALKATLYCTQQA